MKGKVPKRLLSLLLSGILITTGLDMPMVRAAEEPVSHETMAENMRSEVETLTIESQENSTSEIIVEPSEQQTESSVSEIQTDHISSEQQSEHTSTEIQTESTSTKTQEEDTSSGTQTENAPSETQTETASSEVQIENSSSHPETESETPTEETTADNATVETAAPTEENTEIETDNTSSLQLSPIINPLYERLIDYDKYAAKSDSEQNIHLLADSAKAASFQNIDDAVAYLSGQMAARETSISFQVPMSIITENGGPQIAPNDIFNKAIEHTETCSGQEGDALRLGYLRATPAYNSSSGIATLTYTIIYFTTAEQEQQLSEKVSEIMNKLALSDKTDYQKAKAIHDYICDNVTYDDTYSKYSAYDALYTGSAVCQGYAISFYRLCKEAGLSVRIITGKGNGGSHAWNIVRIRDNTRAAGKYYNVDCTWDSQESGTLHLYFLVSEADFGDHVRDEEYNTSDFHAQYPMAESSYIDDSSLEAGLNKENPTVSFTTLEDETVSSTASGKPKLLIFFRTTCGNSRRTIKSISEYRFPNVDIYAAEIDGASKADVSTFKTSYGSDTLTFLYDTTDNNSISLFTYAQTAGIINGNQMSVNLPVLCYIDASNMLQCVTQGVQNASQIEANLNHYCGGPVVGQYIITYILDGGTNHSDNPLKFKETSGIITLEDPTKDGYTFAGWYLDAALTKKISQIDSSVASNITLYAKWSPILATDALNCDNFERYFQTIDDEEVSSMAEGRPKLLIFFSRNCSFSQQTIKDIATNGVPNTDIIAIETLGGTKQEVRGFKNTYGSDAITFAYDQYGVSYNNYANEYVKRSGKNNYSTIIICYVDANNKYQHITFGRSSASAIKTNIDRYCGSAEGPSPSEKYTITYELDGGTNAPDNPATYTLTTETIVLKEPSKDGDSFIGWYLDAGLTQPIKQIEKGSHGNLTLYARWGSSTPNPDDPTPPETYTINYILDGGTNHDDNPTTYTKETETITLKAPAKEGYTFDGWFTDADFTDASRITQIETGSTGDLTLYAKWKDNSQEPVDPPETYTITYKLDGGTNHADNPASYTANTETITLKAPAKEGYTFDGWYTDAAMTNKITQITKDSTGDLTLYAKWTKNQTSGDSDTKPGDSDTTVEPKYTVTFNMNGHGSAPQSITDIQSGELIQKPADPTAQGYRFDGWYKDSSCTTAWNFNTDKVTADTTLYAKWVKLDAPADEDVSKYPTDQRKDLKAAGAKIAEIKSKVYDGSPYTPTVKVTASDNGKQITLTEGVDYRVLYTNNVVPGTAKVTVRGNGTYKGEITKEFQITKKPLKDLNIVAGGMSADAKTDNLPVYIYDGAVELVKGTDYTLSNLTDVKGSSAKVTATAAKSSKYYEGSVTTKVTLYKADADKIINADNVTLSAKSVPFTGKAVTSVVPTVKIGNVTLEKNKQYKVQYKDNTKAGTALVIITGKGQYKGKVIKSFTIEPSKSKFTVSSISDKTYNGKLQKPSVTVKDGTKKLKVNRDYTVTYAKNLSAGKATVTITGIGNYAGSAPVTTTFTIKSQKISKASVKGTVSKGITLTYNKKPLVEGVDYKLTYGAVKNGKTQVTITGIGDFTDKNTKMIKN